jgi:hypothetical protein
MTEVLVIVGVFVFFVSVYGAVMIGGHVLEQLERPETTPDPTPEPESAPSEVGVHQ